MKYGWRSGNTTYFEDRRFEDTVIFDGRIKPHLVKVEITLAILFVIFLVNVIFSKGRTAFQRTTIAVEVNFNTEELELSSNASIEEIQDADFYDLSINSLLKLYKTEGAKQEKGPKPASLRGLRKRRR